MTDNKKVTKKVEQTADPYTAETQVKEETTVEEEQ